MTRSMCLLPYVASNLRQPNASYMAATYFSCNPSCVYQGFDISWACPASALDLCLVVQNLHLNVLHSQKILRLLQAAPSFIQLICSTGFGVMHFMMLRKQSWIADTDCCSTALTLAFSCKLQRLITCPDQRPPHAVLRPKMNSITAAGRQ